METAVPPDALAEPETAADAVTWMELVVRLIGPGFCPDLSFGEYTGVKRRAGSGWLDLTEGEIAQLDGALAAAKRLLGSRAHDAAYRSVDAYLNDIDTSWKAWARPITQPPARWWLVRPGYEGEPDSVAYEDERGAWWEYDPTTERLHSTPWLYTDYYYRSDGLNHRFQRDTPGYPIPGFVALTPEEAKQWMARGIGRREDKQLRAAHERDEHALDPQQLLESRNSRDGPS